MAYIPDHPRAEEAMRRWDELKQGRSSHEQDWEELARLIRPQRGGFIGEVRDRASETKPLSSAPIVAQSNFVSGLYGAMMNPSNRWFGLKVSDRDLADDHEVKLWQDRAGAVVLASFGPQVSPFYSAGIQLFADVASFGNSAQYDEVVRSERRIMDVTLSLAEVVCEIDAFGRVVEVVRKFALTGRQAMAMFRAESLPPKLVEMSEKGGADKVAFFHHVFENRDWRRGSLGPRGKRWLSVYACEKDKGLVREAGYDEMPFFWPRWEVDTGQRYGRGPGMVALPDSRRLNLMEASNLRAGQRASDPTLLAPERDTWTLNGIARPGEVIYGGVDVRGNPLIRPLDTSSGTGLTLEMADRAVENIRDAFHWSLMNLAGRTGMTATEVIERAEERMRMMAPHMGRIQEEYLAPKISRRFFLLWRAGQIPVPPPQLAAGGVALEVEYTSAAAMAQKSAEGAAVVRVLQDIGPLAELKPRMVERLSDDDLVEVLLEARGAPAKILRSREAADEIAAARMQQQQAAQAMEMAQGGAGAMRDLAGAAAAMAPAAP